MVEKLSGLSEFNDFETIKNLKDLKNILKEDWEKNSEVKEKLEEKIPLVDAFCSIQSIEELVKFFQSINYEIYLQLCDEITATPDKQDELVSMINRLDKKYKTTKVTVEVDKYSWKPVIVGANKNWKKLVKIDNRSINFDYKTVRTYKSSQLDFSSYTSLNNFFNAMEPIEYDVWASAEKQIKVILDAYIKNVSKKEKRIKIANLLLEYANNFEKYPTNNWEYSERIKLTLFDYFIKTDRGAWFPEFSSYIYALEKMKASPTLVILVEKINLEIEDNCRSNNWLFSYRYIPAMIEYPDDYSEFTKNLMEIEISLRLDKKIEKKIRNEIEESEIQTINTIIKNPTVFSSEIIEKAKKILE